MTIESLNFESIEYAEADVERTTTIESSFSSLLESGLSRLEKDPRLEKIELSEEEREAVENWRMTAIEVLKDLGCEDLVPRLPEVSDIKLYRVKFDEMAGHIEGGVEEFGQYMLFFVGEGVSLNDHPFRKLYTHELAHIVATRVVGLNAESAAQTSYIGYEKTVEESRELLESGDYKVSKKNKAAFTEPIADVFSYLCSEKEGRRNHFLFDKYVRETSFLLGLMDRMSVANDSNFIEEYSLLFRAFNHRDYSWYKHLLSTFEKIYQESVPIDEETPHTKALNFARDLNNMIFENGNDVLHRDGNDLWGYQLTAVAEKGDFFSNYDKFCNHLVGHRDGLRFKSTNTWIR